MSTYVTVAASQTDSVLGNGAQGQNAGKGNTLTRLIVSVATAATGTVTLEDGTTGGAIVITAANTPIGVYTVELDATSQIGPWQVTTGAGATVIAIGDFS